MARWLASEKFSVQLSPAEIRRVFLKRLGVTLRQIAGEENVHFSTVSTVLAGRQRSRRLELAIARRLGLPHYVAFPEHAHRPRVATVVAAREPDARAEQAKRRSGRAGAGRMR